MAEKIVHHPPPAGNPDDITAQIAQHVTAIVALLVRPSAPSGPTHYTSSGKVKIMPPGITSPRVFAARCASIEGAYPEGRGWVVSVEAWHAARSARPVAPADDAETLLAGAGVRLGRRGAR